MLSLTTFLIVRPSASGRTEVLRQWQIDLCIPLAVYVDSSAGASRRSAWRHETGFRQACVSGGGVVSDQCGDEWGELPNLLKVDEAMRVLRIGRSKAYEMTTLYETSGGTQGLPCLRMGDLLRIPRFALEEFLTTGRIVQLLPKPELDATVNATAPAKSTRTRQSTDRSQLSLLASD